jgi:UDP-N-acetylglucosamine acyltransferase
MIGVHIAHDCIIGDQVILANSAAIAGHAEIADHVIIGGNCGVQQFTRIGKMAMIGGMTGVSRDVIPYGLSLGNRNYLDGINLIGLRRSKVSNKDIICLSDAYKEIFKSESLNDNLGKLNGNFKENIYVQEIIEFINKDKKRPICTPFSK